MGEYFDGEAVECSGELARCDRCGEGLTAIMRMHSQTARERREFEEQMDELRDIGGCLACFVGGAWDTERMP